MATSREELSNDYEKRSTDHGEFYYFLRRPDEAIAQLQKAIDMDSSFVRAHFLRGPALIQKGRCDEGIDEALKAESLSSASDDIAWRAQEYRET